MTCINLSTLGALIHAIFATTLRGMYYYHHSIGVCLFLALFSIIPRPFEILGGGGAIFVNGISFLLTSLTVLPWRAGNFRKE